MNFRKSLITAFILAQAAAKAYALPLAGYQVTKQQDGSTPVVTRGKEYLFNIQAVGSDNLPATSGQASQVSLTCNSGPCTVTAPAASGPYNPNFAGFLAVILRFDTAPDVVAVTASKQTDGSVTGSLNITVEPFPTSFNVSLPNGLNVDAGVPFPITVTALNGVTAITSFKDNVIFRDDILGDIQTVSGSLFVNGVVSTTTILTTGLWATHINHVTTRNSVTYVGGGGVFASGISNNISVAPAAYDRIVMFMPGETATPGIAPGKSGTATAQIAGAGFTPINIYAVDKYYNQLTGGYPVGLTISFGSTGLGPDTLPGATALVSNPLNVGGAIIFNPPLGSRTITATPSVNPTNTSQSVVNATPGAVDHYRFTVQPDSSTSLVPTASGADLVSDIAFTLQITAYDSGNNVQTTINGPVTGALSATLSAGVTGTQVVDTNPGTPASPDLFPDNTITFVNGVANLTDVIISRNSGSGYLTFDIPSDGVTPINSNIWKINPGDAKLIVMTLRGSPGQTFTEGIYPGNSGNAPTITAGNVVQAEMRLTDGRWNIVSGVNASNTTFTPLSDNSTTPQKYIDSSIVSTNFPPSGVASGGSAPNITFRSSGIQRLRAEAGGAYSFTSESSTFTVSPGTYTHLMLVGPGETAHPGIQTALQADGKVGSVTNQQVGVPFNVRVIATDDYWNPIVAASLPQINFNFQDPDYDIVPSIPGLMGAASEDYTVTLQSLSLPQIEVFDNVDLGSGIKRQTISVNTLPGLVHHFTFTLSNGADKEAGTPFGVTIRAKDIFDNTITSLTGYNVNLLANTGATTMSPEVVTLTAGVFAGNLTMYTATTTARVQMSSGSVTSTSASFIVTSNGSTAGYKKLLLLLPGETMTPGMALGTVGKSGSPTPVTVGNAISIRAISCDQYYNPMDPTPGGPVTIQFASNKFATFLASIGSLTNVDGHGEFSTTLSLRTAGTHSITLRDQTNDATIARSTSSITGLIGTYAKLQLLAPGEVADPGTSVPTGKSTSTVAAQQNAGVPFTVTINAVDNFWNIITTYNSGDIELSANPSNVLFTPPNNLPGNNGVRPFINGVGTRDVILGQQGIFDLAAVDKTDLTKDVGTIDDLIVNPGPIYVSTVPTTATAGTPFGAVAISLSSNGVALNGYNGTIFLTAVLSSGAASAGQFTPDGTPKAYNLTNGAIVINDLVYQHSERIKIKITDNFNRVGFSNDIEVGPSGLKYRVTVPTYTVIAGPPAPTGNFPVTVELLDLNTNTLVKNHDHAIDVEVLSAVSPVTTGSFTVTSANFSQGVATFEQAYTKAESVVVRITESATAGDPGFNPGQKTSNNVGVKSAGYKKLLILAPGETQVPGVASATGKTGTPTLRQVGVSFLVQIRGVDQYWNTADEFSGAQINLASNDLPPSLSTSNPTNQNGPLVSGASASNIIILTPGNINVTVKDNTPITGASIGQQTVQLTVAGSIYDISVPATEITGPPNTFAMTVTLIDAISSSVVTSANHTVDLIPMLSSGVPASGALGVTSANIVGGVANIPNQSYSIAENIFIRAVERTTNPTQHTGNSPIIQFIPRAVRYTFDMPTEAFVNIPFQVVIKTIDDDTGTEVRNLNRTNGIEAWSAVTGMLGTGTFTPNPTVDIVNGQAVIQAVYTKTETIFLKMTDNTPGGNPSPPTQAVFTSQGSVNIKPGALAALDIVDFDMRSNQTSNYHMVARDAAGNPIPAQSLVFTVTSIGDSGQMLINGNVNSLTQDTNGFGEIDVLFDPSPTTNGMVGLIVRDGDNPNGFSKIFNINVKGFTLLGLERFREGQEYIPLSSTLVLDDVPNIPTNGGTLQTFYRVDGGAWTLYDPNIGISAFTQLRRYQLEWYSEICYDIGCLSPVSQLDANGGSPNSRFIVTMVQDGQISGFPSPFNPHGTPNYMTITYELPTNSNVEIDIYDLFGQKIWHKDIEAGQNGGIAGQSSNLVPWLGVNDEGVGVAAGGYIVRVKVGATGQVMKQKVLVVK